MYMACFVKMKPFSLYKYRNSFSNVFANRRNISASSKLLAMPVIAPDNVYLEKPKYPEIRDTSKIAKERYRRLDRYDEIKKMKSVPEKILAVSTSKRKTCYLLPGKLNFYGATEFVQHITKTRLLQGMPEQYNSFDVTPLVEIMRKPLLDAVVCENSKIEWALPFHLKQDNVEETDPTKSLIDSVLTNIISTLASQYEHLVNCHLTTSPRCDAFWWRANDHTDISKGNRQKKSRYVLPKFQLEWRPDFILRVDDPLPPVLDRDDPECTSSEVPYCPYFPSNYGVRIEPKRFPTCTPGFWPGDRCEFPLLSVCSSTPILDDWYSHFGNNDLYDSLDQAAMINAFGWLLSTATIQGFTQYHELTYPLVGQSIYTNGQQWSFYIYQMNTLTLHPDVDQNTHCNLCWSSGPMNLYENIEDGQVMGVNDEVLKLLLQFILNRPRKRPGINLKPYLDEESVTAEEKQEKLVLMKRQFDMHADVKHYLRQVPTWHHVYKYNPEAPLSPRVKLW